MYWFKIKLSFNLRVFNTLPNIFIYFVHSYDIICIQINRDKAMGMRSKLHINVNLTVAHYWQEERVETNDR